MCCLLRCTLKSTKSPRRSAFACMGFRSCYRHLCLQLLGRVSLDSWSRWRRCFLRKRLWNAEKLWSGIAIASSIVCGIKVIVPAEASSPCPVLVGEISRSHLFYRSERRSGQRRSGPWRSGQSSKIGDEHPDAFWTKLGIWICPGAR